MKTFTAALTVLALIAVPAQAQMGGRRPHSDDTKAAPKKPQVDDKNHNPSLARRPMIGLPLFSGMRLTGPNSWSGEIYNADDGNTYASNVSVAGPDALRVEGCVGALCGGETWTRTER